MPPKARQNNYFGEGQGRKTGITLPDTGIRDEYGIETADIFSSPEKSEVMVTSERREDGTLVTSESMELQQSTQARTPRVYGAYWTWNSKSCCIGSMPDPTEALSVRQVLTTKRTALPPKSRSPIKTALGSSPRRQSSMGPPARSQPNSHHAVRRKLDFNDSQEGISTSSPEAINGVVGDDLYDLPGSPTEANGQEHTNQDLEEVEALPELEDATEQQSTAEEAENSSEEHEEMPPEMPSSPPKKRGRKRKLVVEEAEAESEGRATKNARRGARKPVVEKIAPTKSKRTTRSSLNSSQVQEDSIALAPEPVPATEESPVEETPRSSPARKRAVKGKVKTGPTRKAREPSVVVEEEPSIAKSKNRGRPKRDVAIPREESGTSMPPPQLKSRGRLPKERDPNAKTTARKAPRGRSESKAPTEMSMMSGRTTQSTMSNVRQYVVVPKPGADDWGRSRAGRALRRPLAGWRGEKDTFDHQGNLIESVLTEDVTPVKLDRRRGNKKKNRQSTIFEEPEIEELEEWEQDPGVLSGIVNVWDNDIEHTTGEKEEELAYAAPSIQTQQVNGAEFKYTRICGVRFFNAGMVDLPPYSEKKRKNSRRMYMIFYVLRGQVQVTVGDNPEFSIHSGGVWQVPRGNLYSIKNSESQEAKIFFSQACRTRPDEEEE
ncbi:hypothetical protein EJ05DRAFT_122664 [Pseudovirgaria hyperparasitica]|uniref:CENP-C homolog n=1 Tax=Pseudovirgaria hyperparasitica TaxID=470096 RepID=A0A6A6VZD9_9PEZI|nr:uncharacterized protein EJ05DRAFT_122664 [Pseudovirgaria hyperparasitica]KAF2755104.1 hypothetical protein EJ05DRAFT_122664 [Pseudovirgaria hyperparasitica]